MARYVPFLVFSIAVQFSFAQQPLERHLVKLNFLLPGLTYELGVYENMSLNVDGLLRFSFFIEDPYNNNPHDEGYFIGFLSSQITLQYYFNRTKREERGRSVYNNSGMFIGPSLMVWSRDIINTNQEYYYLPRGVAAGAVWGIQRTFKNNLNFTFLIGPGIQTTDDDPSRFALLTKFTFGYVLFSKPPKDYKRPLPDFSPDDY